MSRRRRRAPVEGIKKLLPYKDYKEMIRPESSQ